MRSVGRWVAAALVTGGLTICAACGGGDSTAGGSSNATSGGGTGGGSSGSPDGGTGGQGGGSGGGGGGQDGGTGGTDAGTLQTINFPNSPGWSFYGPQNGGPQDVYDSTMDEGGNLWVAGGAEGLFLMRADGSGNLSGKFEKFGIAEGLHPYGWLNGEVAKAMGVPDGSPADPHPSLAATPVISVAGGPAGTVFVGYQGKDGCESAWAGDQWTPATRWGDPSVYKSGDADRVTIAGKGISVVHYDIFSGPGVVSAEIKGREKLCSVYRIAWDKAKNAVWFGGNHGFAVARADAPETPTCNGEPSCSPVWEHSHPAISGCSVDYDLSKGEYCPPDKTQWLTDGYYGVAVDPTNHDLWLGGTNRTTKFHSGTYGGNYDWAADDTEIPAGTGCRHSSNVCGMADRWDLWPDQYPEWDAQHGIIYVCSAMRTAAKKNDLDDNVSGIAALPDGTAWVASSSHGLLHVDSAGRRLADATGKLMTSFIAGVAYDPSGAGSIWAGMAWGLGISRLDLATGNVTNYSGAAPLDPNATLGDKLSSAPVSNVQSFPGAGGRRMLVGFHKFSLRDKTTQQLVNYAGAVAVYRGN